MRHGWKRLAERAWNPAFDDTERCEALAEALRGDWTDEVPQPLVRRLRDVLDDVQGDVFGDPLTVRIEGLRGENTAGPLAATLLDCAIQAAHHGCSGGEALEVAARDALLQRAESGRRQVEEHWLRTPAARSADRVRNRINGAIVGSDMTVIARRCIGPAPRASLKRTGIDDGVSFS